MKEQDFSGIQQVIYIKLGEGGSWERQCLQDGTIRVGFYEVPSDLAQSRDVAAIRQIYINDGVDSGTATRYVGELIKFYNADETTLWITFSGGMLYWAISKEPPVYLGADKATYPLGSTLRQTMSGWHNTSLAGYPLHTRHLSGRLTKVVGYRGTICTLGEKERDYLLRRLQDQKPEEVIQAEIARTQLLQSCENLIKLLPWPDFELLVDLIFTQSGWRRVGSLGGTQKTADIELAQPMTGEQAIVQVKSSTTARELAEYEAAFAGMTADRYFYVWHTSKDPLVATLKNLTVIGPDRLAEHVLNAGLYDWLIQKNA